MRTPRAPAAWRVRPVEPRARFPESAVRLADSHHGPADRRRPRHRVPPVPPPPVADPPSPVTFDDGRQPRPADPAARAGPRPGTDDKAMGSINRRPRRLARAGLAVVAVLVLIVVLLW